MNLSKLLPWNWFRTKRGPGEAAGSTPPPAGTGLCIVRPPQDDEEGWPDPESLDCVRYELDRLLDHAFSGFGFSAPHLQAAREAGRLCICPRTRLERRQDCTLMQVDLPGVREQDITLTLRGRTLALLAPRLADRHDTADPDRAVFHVLFELEPDADPNAIGLSFGNSVLVIRAPRLCDIRPAARDCE